MLGEEAGTGTETVGPQTEKRPTEWLASKLVLHAAAAPAWLQQSSPEAGHLFWCGECKSHFPKCSLCCYSDWCAKSSFSFQNSDEYQMIQDGCLQYEVLAQLLSKQRKEAESTYTFWKSFSGKSSVSFKTILNLIYLYSNRFKRTVECKNLQRFKD